MSVRLPTVLATLLVFLLCAPVGFPVRAAESSEIPGVPLTSTSVSGFVGGSIYDEVYSLSVESGTVLLATLRGEAGAELGLYVFGREATSILIDDPIATSAAAGANQTVSVQFFRATTIYINVNGRNSDRAYAFQLTVSQVVDRSPPVITVASLPPVARAARVCVEVAAFDRISGVQSVAITRSGRADELEWQPYQGHRRYCQALALEEGLHEIDLLVRNHIGLQQRITVGGVAIDNTVPLVTLGRPTAGVLLQPRGTISWRFSEPVRTTTALRDAVVAVGQDGTPFSGVSTLSLDRTSLRWVPNQPIPIGTLLVVTLAGVRDQAGNRTTSIEPHVLMRKSTASLGIEVRSFSGPRIQFTVRGSANLIGEVLQIQARSGRTWLAVKYITLSAREQSSSIPRGDYSQIRVVWAGNELVHQSSALSLVFGL